MWLMHSFAYTVFFTWFSAAVDLLKQLKDHISNDEMAMEAVFDEVQTYSILLCWKLIIVTVWKLASEIGNAKDNRES